MKMAPRPLEIVDVIGRETYLVGYFGSKVVGVQRFGLGINLSGSKRLTTRTPTPQNRARSVVIEHAPIMTEIISKSIVKTYALNSNWFFLNFLCRTTPNRRKIFLFADPRFAADGYQKIINSLKSLIVSFLDHSEKKIN